MRYSQKYVIGAMVASVLFSMGIALAAFVPRGLFTAAIAIVDVDATAEICEGYYDEVGFTFDVRKPVVIDIDITYESRVAVESDSPPPPNISISGYLYERPMIIMERFRWSTPEDLTPGLYNRVIRVTSRAAPKRPVYASVIVRVIEYDGCPFEYPDDTPYDLQLE